MRNLILTALCSVALLGCGAEYDPTIDRFTGAEAKSRISREVEANKSLPDSAGNFYIYDGGTFNGSIIYAAFDCENREDCWQAVAALGAPEQSEFKPGAASQHAVVMEGPGFYHEQLRSDPWDVRGITDGVAYERVQGEHQAMYYYAIDFEKNRVYFHRESGGFPSQQYEGKAKTP